LLEIEPEEIAEFCFIVDNQYRLRHDPFPHRKSEQTR